MKIKTRENILDKNYYFSLRGWILSLLGLLLLSLSIVFLSPLLAYVFITYLVGIVYYLYNIYNVENRIKKTRSREQKGRFQELLQDNNFMNNHNYYRPTKSYNAYIYKHPFIKGVNFMLGIIILILPVFAIGISLEITFLYYFMELLLISAIMYDVLSGNSQKRKKRIKLFCGNISPTAVYKNGNKFFFYGK